VNVEDFYWHEAATELQKSPVIAHRVWMHFSDLKRLEAQGQYQNVDELKDARDQAGEYARLPRITDGTSRSKDMIEVLEIWWKEPDGIYTVTLGNRAVELSAPKKNPFWHGEYPFVVCTTRPDLFSIPGEPGREDRAPAGGALGPREPDARQRPADEQRDLHHRRRGHRPRLARVRAGRTLAGRGQPERDGHAVDAERDPRRARAAAPRPARAEMQNLAGGHPFTSTSEARTVGADTATRRRSSTNIAERATVRLKEQLAYAYERIGQQRTELNQQFLRTSIMVEQIGLDTESEFVEIAPYLLQGDYLFDIAPMVESLMRSERRAEANAMFQTFLQAAGLYMALAKAGAATAAERGRVRAQWLESYDVGDVDRFFSAKPQPPRPPRRQPAARAARRVAGPGGVTAPQSIDPATSPSAQASLSGPRRTCSGSARYGGVSNT
jgi:hypothetical protein